MNKIKINPKQKYRVHYSTTIAKYPLLG